MAELLVKRSSMEDHSFGGSFGATVELPMVTAEIAGGDDFLLDDFEFAFSSIKSEPDPATETNADKIFNNCRILPVYPIFNRVVVDGGLKALEEGKLEGGVGHLVVDLEKKDQRSELKSSSSSIPSEAKELDQIGGATAKYGFLKSNSTGTVALESRRKRLRDIVFGRSRSEGDRLLLVPASEEKKMEMSCFFLFSSGRKSVAKEAEAEKKGKSRKENRGVVKKLDFVGAHRIFYGGGISGGGKMAIAGSRRSFLPYRQELLAGCSFCHSRRNNW